LQVVRGANREEEIAASSNSISARPAIVRSCSTNNSGLPVGYRAVANILTSTSRIKMTLGLPSDATDMDLIAFWRRYHERQQTFRRHGATGLVLENTMRGADVDLLKIPAPNGTNTTAAITSAPAAW